MHCFERIYKSRLLREMPMFPNIQSQAPEFSSGSKRAQADAQKFSWEMGSAVFLSER